MPKDRATIDDLVQLNGDLRRVARRLQDEVGDKRDPSLIMDELLIHIGMPNLAEPLDRLRRMATA